MAPVKLTTAGTLENVAGTQEFGSATRIFIASNSRRIAVFETSGGALQYCTSADGVTWTSPASLSPSTVGYVSAAYLSDTLYWTTTNGSASLNKSAFNTGTNLFGGVTSYTVATVTQGPIMAWDSTNSVFHVASYTTLNTTMRALTTTGTVSNSLSSIGISPNNLFAIACIPGATSTIYLLYYDGSATAVKLLPLTYTSGGGYVAGTVETPVSGNYPAYMALDNTNIPDIVYRNGTGLYALRRTGTNTYGGATNIANSVVAGTTTPELSTDGSGGLLCVYESSVNQANGELFGVLRPGGSTWQSPFTIAGGASTGFQQPRAAAAITSGRVDALYLDGTSSTGNVWYASYTVGSAPNTPVNASPANASYVGTLTPSFSWTVSNPSVGDPNGGYEIIVTRVSDSTVMWDSGVVNSSAISGIVYAGTTLAYGTQYKWKVREKDANLGSFSGYSTETTFTPTQSGTVSITSVAGSSGTASSTLASNTSINATSLTVATGQGSRFTNGKQIAVGTSPNIDIVTITAPPSGDTLTVGTMAHAHSSSDPVVEADTTITLGSPTGIVTTWAWTQPQSDAANAYTLNLYQNDGVTLVATTSGAISPTEASSASQSSASWSPSGLSNSTTYMLAASITDATTGVVATSPQVTVNASWTPPSAPTSFTVTPLQNSGYMSLAWTNAGGIASVNVFRRPNGGSTWTTISSGTLITALKDYCPLNTAYDYGVQSVSSTGGTSTITTVTNKTLTVTDDGCGYWFCDVTAPTTTSVAIPGDLSQSNTGTQLQHHEDVTRFLPEGRPKPIASYGVADWWDATSRQHYIPGTCNSLSYSTVVANMQSLSTTHATCLYRDPTGEWRIVNVDNFEKWAGDSGLDAYLQFDLTEQSSSLTVLTA